MKNCIVVISAVFILTSCASIVNKKLTTIEVRTSPDSATVCLDNDSCFKSPLYLEVPRSYSDFNIVVKADSVKKTIRIKSRVSPEFKWGNLLFLYGSPLGYMVDASSRKKIYTYDKSIYVDLHSKQDYYQKWKLSKKGQRYVRGSLPFADFVEVDNGRGLEYFKSYLGVTVGIDYYHSKHSFISLSGGATGISDLAFPLTDRLMEDTLKVVKSFSAKLTNNHDVNIFSTENICLTLGYGLSFTHFRYSETLEDTVSHEVVELYKNNQSALGICLQANLILFKYGFIGVNVSQSYYTLESHKWEYSSLTYFDFGVRFPLGNYYKKGRHKVVRYTPKLIE